VTKRTNGFDDQALILTPINSDDFDMHIRVSGCTGDGETRVTNACRARNGKSRTKSPLPLGHGHRIVHYPDIAKIIEAA
jgi:hypothetical protein